MIDGPHGRQRQHIRLKAFEVDLGLPFEDIVGDYVDRAELPLVDRGKPLEIAFAGGALRREIGVAHIIAEPIGIAQVAAIQRVDRIAPERSFVTVLEELEKLGVGRGRRRLDCRGR